MALAVVERAGASDVGRQRKANEDSYLESSPVFAVADGMGGARAGEVASRMAVEAFEEESDGAASPEERLAAIARAANAKIHQLAQEDESRAGMGTTLTAVMVHDGEVATGHVGDSRLYRFRAGDLERLTNDHSLVEELVRQGKLSPESAETHPQRSIITRALGPEPTVEVDTFTCPGRDGDVYLLCSDGLTGMVAEERIAQILRSSASLSAAAQELIGDANDNGGRDNITVVLFRLGETGGVAADSDAATGTIDATEVRAALAAQETRVGSGPSTTTMLLDPAPQTDPRTTAEPLDPSEPGPVRRARPAPPRRRRRGRRALALLVGLVAILAVAGGLWAASRQVYFVGTDDQALVTLYRGLPYDLPFDVELYTTEHSSSVPAASLPKVQREAVLDHKLRSRDDAVDLVMQLERRR